MESTSVIQQKGPHPKDHFVHIFRGIPKTITEVVGETASDPTTLDPQAGTWMNSFPCDKPRPEAISTSSGRTVGGRALARRPVGGLQDSI